MGLDAMSGTEVRADEEMRLRRRQEWKKRIQRTLVGVPVVSVFVFLGIPTIAVALMSFTPRSYIEFLPSGFSLHHFVNFVNHPAWMNSVGVSLRAAGIAVLVSLLVGTTAAVALHGRTFRGRGVVMGLLLTPIAAPMVALALAFFVFFSQFGLVGRTLSIGLGHAVLTTPFVFLTVTASLAGLDPALVRAARSLGANVAAVFWYVYRPVIIPGVLGGAILSFAVSFDEPVIAFFLQGVNATTLPVRMFTEVRYALTPLVAVAATLTLFVAVILLVIYQVVLAGRSPRGPLLVDLAESEE